MARGQQDYYQATRGGGHGDYRHIVLAPHGHRARRVELAQLAFHLADKWRNPVLVYGDYLLAHTQEARRRSTPIDVRPSCPAKDWAVDGSLGGHRAARESVTPLGVGKAGQRALGQRGQVRSTSRRRSPRSEREVRVETGYLDDAETVIVAFGSPAQVRAVRRRAAARRRAADRLRPPDHAVAVPVRRPSRAAAEGARARRRRSSCARVR